MAKLLISIIYEDDDILAVNKPAGIVVHGDSPNLVEWLVKNYPQIKKVGEDPERPGIVHRLDKDTSGVLLVAKTQKAFEYLKEQFQNRKIQKKYLVLVQRIVKNNKGIIDLPIGKSKKDFRKKLAGGKMIGKTREAITEYIVVKRFPACAGRPSHTLLEVFPKTGRTHQIRAHFKAIGHPIVCDKLYGSKIGACLFGLNRQFLHASSLELNLLSGARIKLEADLPEDLDKVLKELRKNK